MNRKVRSLVLAAVCVALGLVLPFLTGQIPSIGSKLSPMHIPVLLCGFLCGWQYGLAAGFVLPLLRNLLFGMPPMPVALIMAFEMATYGLCTGLLYKFLPKKPAYVYVTLIASMLIGRVVWGVVRALMTLAGNNTFSFAAFIAGAFTTAIPGIILQQAVIPALVLALQKAKLVPQAV